MGTIDRYAYRSALRNVNAQEKFWFAILTMIICVAGRSVLVSGAVFLLNGYLTVAKGGLSLKKYGKLLTIPLVFLVLGTLTVWVNLGDTPMDAFALPLGNLYLTGSVDGIRQMAKLFCIVMASVSCLYFLSLNTPMTDIIFVLEKIHIPRLVIELMMLIYRFAFILFSTASSIMTAQRARLGNRNLAASVRSFGKMGAGLFVKALKKSDALYISMESRLYEGRLRVLHKVCPAKKGRIAAVGVLELALILCTALEKGYLKL